MNSPLLNKVAVAKPLLKEVLLIGGPGDGCRMPVNLNMSQVNVIDDAGVQHAYRKMSLENGGLLILYIHSSIEKEDVMKKLISGYNPTEE